MDYINDSQLEQLLENGSETNRDKDNYPIVMLQVTDRNKRWLLVDTDHDDPDFFLALYDNGTGFPEFVYVSLPLLKSAAERENFICAQDFSFKAKYPISVYARASRKHGSITEDENLLLPIYETHKDEVITLSSLIVEVDTIPKVEIFMRENFGGSGGTSSRKSQPIHLKK